MLQCECVEDSLPFLSNTTRWRNTTCPRASKATRHATMSGHAVFECCVEVSLSGVESERHPSLARSVKHLAHHLEVVSSNPTGGLKSFYIVRYGRNAFSVGFSLQPNVPPRASHTSVTIARLSTSRVKTFLLAATTNVGYPPSSCRLWEDGWKERYYVSKFDINSDNVAFRHEVVRYSLQECLIPNSCA